MDESEFKKLASNSRDWLLYQLLSERSKELIPVEYGNKTFSRTPLKDKIDAYDKELGSEKETTSKGLGGLSLSKSPTITHSKLPELKENDSTDDSKTFHPNQTTDKGETTIQETCVLKNVKIVHETEKAFIVNLIGTNFTTVVAKSHLEGKYSKDDVRTDLVFKNERKWALEKLKWEEKK